MQTPYYTTKQAPGWASKLALMILHALGWKFRYDGFPGNRGVIIFYPHTSNWDFLYGILAKWAINLPLKFLVKEKLFKGPTGFVLGAFVRYWGGEPIERGVSSGAISTLAERIQKSDWFWLAITPEGTRSYSPYWRSGFYHIALTAKVPLVCAYIDYPKRELGLGPVLELSGDQEADLNRIREVYQGLTGKRPDQAGTIQFKP